MNNLVLGQGEIGKSVAEVLRIRYDSVYTYDVTDKKLPRVTNVMDFMHICFPYSATFVNDVKDYVTKYDPAYVIIWSTVPIGTTKKIPHALHSPVEGRHPHLAKSIMHMTRFVGHNGLEDFQLNTLKEFFGTLHIGVHFVGNSDETEFLKLRSTSKYGINLAWANYEQQVALTLGMDFELINEFDREYNRLYQELGMDWAQRYILTPPNGFIGGHCVVPNAILLNEQYPDEMLSKIIEMGPKEGR